MKPFLSLSALFLFFMASQSWAEEFRLQIGDRLEISVIRVPDVGREAMIGPDGAVRVGGVVVDVAGMTLRDAGAAIAGALSETLGVDLWEFHVPMVLSAMKAHAVELGLDGSLAG